jgi:hypothetical protein
MCWDLSILVFAVDSNDSIVWSWDVKGGKVSAKQAYEVQFIDDSDDGLRDGFLAYGNGRFL